MLIVAPSGIVKEEIFLDTPTFLDRVSMDIGMVALDVAVENANAITGKNFLMNFIGFSPVKIFSRIWYTPKHWIASARRTPIIYFASGINALKPMFAKVRADQAEYTDRCKCHDHHGHLHHDVIELAEKVCLLSLHALPFSQGSHLRSGQIR